jgi:hypothetical protein
MKTGRTYKTCNMNQPMTTLCLLTVKGTVMSFRISLSQQCEVICGLLSFGMCLQHDNAQPHTAHHTMTHTQDLKMEVLPHLPYSPDLAFSNFHLFWPLKDALCGCNFRSDEEVKEAVHE